MAIIVTSKRSKMKYLLVLLLMTPYMVLAQEKKGVLKGRVYEEINNEPIPFVNIYIEEVEIGATTDIDGNYEIQGIQPGVYTVRASFVGYQPVTKSEITIDNSKPTDLDFGLQKAEKELEEVVVKSSPFKDSKQSPVSLRTLNATEINRYPGGNRDVSKVIQSLPGVAATVSFRNDIIIRGGAPSENKFYLDGIEVPNINHFATQGSSGGPVGLLNVNLIREVDFYSAAFPANRANGLSSVIAFQQKEGNSDRFATTFTVGSSDFGLTFDGPLGDKANFIFSARTSYLQLLFKLLELPFLPTYNDAQFKINYKIDQKNEITFIGLGALDLFKLNKSVNDDVEDSLTYERNNYILGYLPTQNQWNYTIGTKYTHYFENSYLNIVLSRNYLNNTARKYRNNDDSDAANKLLQYESAEAENKFRIEHTLRRKGWRINYGGGYEYAKYTNSTYKKVTIGSNVNDVTFSSVFDLHKFSLFGQISKSFFGRKLDVSLGVRTDFANYTSIMANPLEQISPILSIGYNIDEGWSINASIGKYHQLPAYTILGYRDSTGALANKNNGLEYIEVDHYVLGVEYRTGWRSRFSVEGFFKYYRNYPYSIQKQISLANTGADFGVIGNEPVTSTSTGRSYGAEFLYQQKLTKGFYGILAYTYVRSEFENNDNTYIPSSWDSRHIVSLTGGKKFKKGWQVGVRWLFSGGSPYTPYDIETSALKAVWDANQQGVLDYSRLNGQRLSSFHQLDIRIDKIFNFKKWDLTIYIDVQNVYNFKAEQQDYLVVETNASGQPLTDPDDPSRYQVKQIENEAGTVIPTLGVITKF